MIQLNIIAYRVMHGGLTGAEGRIVSNGERAILRIRDHDRTESDETTIDALLRKAEAGIDELGPLLLAEGYGSGSAMTPQGGENE
jgi:hypothetical protein